MRNFKVPARRLPVYEYQWPLGKAKRSFFLAGRLTATVYRSLRVYTYSKDTGEHDGGRGGHETT